MKLSDMNLLSGKTENITLSELRKSPGDVFAQVELGKRFNVTKRGKVIAMITRPGKNWSNKIAEIAEIVTFTDKNQPSKTC